MEWHFVTRQNVMEWHFVTRQNVMEWHFVTRQNVKNVLMSSHSYAIVISFTQWETVYETENL